jgi:hypothetical protein
MEYDFQLVHISEKKNGRADALSRHQDYDQGEEDNRKLMVLPASLFKKAQIRVAGSEEANPNNQGDWERQMKKKLSLYRKVVKDQQM